MPAQRKLSKRDLNRIVSRAEAGKTQKQIQDETGFGQSIVGPVLVWGGFRKSRPDIVKLETARVERWLGQAPEAVAAKPRRPKRP